METAADKVHGRERERGKEGFIPRKQSWQGFSASVDIICISKEFETGEIPFTLQKSPEKIK
jgi:hypothetical protein